MDSERVSLVRAAYSQFNAEEISGVVDLLDPEVEMPDVIHGTVLHGKDAVERFWRRELDLAEHLVIPMEVLEVGDEVLVVAYHQRYERDGAVLGQGVGTVHRLTFRGDRIVRVDVSLLDPIPVPIRERLG